MKWPTHWRGATWMCSDEGALTEADLRAVWTAIPQGNEAICRAARAGRRGMSSRRVNRALQLLKERGFVRWTDRKTGWRRTTPKSSTLRA